MQIYNAKESAFRQIPVRIHLCSLGSVSARPDCYLCYTRLPSCSPIGARIAISGCFGFRMAILESRVHWHRVDFVYQSKYFANKLQSMTLVAQKSAQTCRADVAIALSLSFAWGRGVKRGKEGAGGATEMANRSRKRTTVYSSRISPKCAAAESTNFPKPHR